MATQAPPKPRALCLMGPTASGKTSVAIELAKTHPVEIISVDSALVYQGLNIGSGKPDADTLARIPHHLVDIRDPASPYSAADFRHDALQTITNILERGNTPVLAGGTMLYFKVLRDGLADMPEADEAVREAISALAQEKGWPAVHARLAEIDPESAKRLKPTDSQRLQRALEVYEISGVTMTELHKREQAKPDDLPAELVFVAMYPEERATLHERIALRFHDMLDQGLVDEVRKLHERKDLNSHLPAIRSVGYRQVWDYLDGHYDYATMVEKAIAATRQLAKRQYTWLRRWPDLHILNSETPLISQSCWQILHSKE